MAQPPIVGSVAKYDFGSSNRSVIARVKRVIGHYYNDREIQPFIDCFGAPVVESHGKACFSLSPSGRIITPVDVVSDILQSVIHTAEQVTGEPSRRTPGDSTLHTSTTTSAPQF